MCTVVLRCEPGRPTPLLALRDELVGRPFDEPDAWWPEHPGVVGGRDRTAGGTWCATHVPTARTAVVLNRPDKRVADAGAPSRGVLPLLALQHGEHWPQHLDPAGMASWTLGLVTAGALLVWDFDGTRLTRTEPGPGTHVLTSGGAERAKADRWQPVFATRPPGEWVDVVTATRPQDDPGALLVRHPVDPTRTFATVFGQYLQAEPGRLLLRATRRPHEPDWPESEHRG